MGKKESKNRPTAALKSTSKPRSSFTNASRKIKSFFEVKSIKKSSRSAQPNPLLFSIDHSATSKRSPVSNHTPTLAFSLNRNAGELQQSPSIEESDAGIAETFDQEDQSIDDQTTFQECLTEQDLLALGYKMNTTDDHKPPASNSTLAGNDKSPRSTYDFSDLDFPPLGTAAHQDKVVADSKGSVEGETQGEPTAKQKKHPTTSISTEATQQQQQTQHSKTSPISAFTTTILHPFTDTRTEHPSPMVILNTGNSPVKFQGFTSPQATVENPNKQQTNYPFVQQFHTVAAEQNNNNSTSEPSPTTNATSKQNNNNQVLHHEVTSQLNTSQRPNYSTTSNTPASIDMAVDEVEVLSHFTANSQKKKKRNRRKKNTTNPMDDSSQSISSLETKGTEHETTSPASKRPNQQPSPSNKGLGTSSPTSSKPPASPGSAGRNPGRGGRGGSREHPSGRNFPRSQMEGRGRGGSSNPSAVRNPTPDVTPTTGNPTTVSNTATPSTQPNSQPNNNNTNNSTGNLNNPYKKNTHNPRQSQIPIPPAQNNSRPKLHYAPPTSPPKLRNQLNPTDDSTVAAGNIDSAQTANIPTQIRTGQTFVPYRKFRERFDWRVPVAASSTPDGALREALCGVFRKLREADRTLIIYGYSEKPTDQVNDDDTPIKPWDSLLSPDLVPKVVSSIQRYFVGAIPKGDQGGFIFPQVHMGFSTPWSSIAQELGTYFGGLAGIQIWRRPVQSEKTILVGWALYSTINMSRELLAAQLSKLFNIEIGLRWRIISTGKAGRLEKDEQIRAFHFEVAKQDRRKATRGLFALYSLDSTTPPPLGIAFRIVPIVESLMSPTAREDAAKARLRQKGFVKHMKVVKSVQILELDIQADEHSYSMREHIMAIKRKSAPSKSLFFSVDPHFRESGAVMFTFHPDVEAEAHNMIACLLPFLRHNLTAGRYFTTPQQQAKFLQVYLYQFFSEGAIEAADGVSWNNETWEVESARDKYVQELLAGDSDFHFETRTDLVDEVPLANLPARPFDPDNDTEKLASFGNMTTTSLTIDSVQQQSQGEPSQVSQTSSLQSVATKSTTNSKTSTTSGKSAKSEMSLLRALAKLGTRIDSLPDTPENSLLRSQIQATASTASSLVTASSTKKSGSDT